MDDGLFSSVSSGVHSTVFFTAALMNSAVCLALSYELEMITSISLVDRRRATLCACLIPNSERPTDATWCLFSALYWLSACRTKYTFITRTPLVQAIPRRHVHGRAACRATRLARLSARYSHSCYITQVLHRVQARRP